MFDRFSLEALKETRKRLANEHLKPPIETLIHAAIPLFAEMVDEEIARRGAEEAPAGNAQAAAAK